MSIFGGIFVYNIHLWLISISNSVSDQATCTEMSVLTIERA